MATTPLCCIYRLQRKRKEKSSHQITTLLSSKPDIKGEPRGRSIKDPINKNGVKNTHRSFSLDLWSCMLKACLQLSSYTVTHPLIFRQWYFMFMGYGGESGYNCHINRSSTFKAPTVLHNFLLIQLKHSIPDLHPILTHSQVPILLHSQPQPQYHMLKTINGSLTFLALFGDGFSRETHTLITPLQGQLPGACVGGGVTVWPRPFEVLASWIADTCTHTQVTQELKLDGYKIICTNVLGPFHWVHKCTFAIALRNASSFHSFPSKHNASSL